MACGCNQEKIFQHPQIKDFTIEIQSRYMKDNNQNSEKEWFTTNIPQICYSSEWWKDKNQKEIKIKFKDSNNNNNSIHTLKSSQIIKILDGEIINQKGLHPVMLINDFDLVNEEKSKNFYKSIKKQCIDCSDCA